MLFDGSFLISSFPIVVLPGRFGSLLLFRDLLLDLFLFFLSFLFLRLLEFNRDIQSIDLSLVHPVDSILCLFLGVIVDDCIIFDPPESAGVDSSKI